MSILHTFDIQHPIIQAPMAGVTTPEFVAASCEVGIVGSIGAGYSSARGTREAIRAVRALTERPFIVNVFVPDDAPFDQDQLREAYEALQPIGEQLGVPFWKVPLSEPNFSEQMEVILEEKPAACSFTFGIPTASVIQRLKEAGIRLIGTATTLDEAIAIEQAGFDYLVLQGAEAGGHRGSFDPEGPLVPLDELFADVHRALQIPLIVAGGIADRKGMDKFLALGAVAVQIGTALLATNESGAADAYKSAVLHADLDATVITKVFSGRPARGIQNAFIDQMHRAPIAPYPYQNDLTKRLRKEAAIQGKADFLSLWAGTSVGQTRSGSVRDVIQHFLEPK